MAGGAQSSLDPSALVSFTPSALMPTLTPDELPRDDLKHFLEFVLRPKVWRMQLNVFLNREASVVVPGMTAIEHAQLRCCMVDALAVVVSFLRVLLRGNPK